MQNKPFPGIARIITTFIFFLLFIIICYIISFTVSQIFQFEKYSAQSIFIVAAFAALCVILALYAHNLGHYLMGILFGYKLLKWSITDFVMVPYKRHATVRKQFFYILGGILFEFILCILLILSVFTFPNVDSLIRLFAFFAAIGCLFHCFIILSPFFSGDKPGDEKLLKYIIFRKNYARNYLYANNFKQAVLYGYRPREIPLATFNKTFRNNITLLPGNFILVLNLYYKSLDSRNIKDILMYADILESNFSEIPEALYNTINSELCFINCIKGDFEKSSFYYGNVRDHLENCFEPAVLRTRAYYEFYVGENKEAALFYAKAALSFCESSSLKGMVDIEAELANELLEQVV